ncbi:beta-N-acetylhexosaminidase [Reichenbachiella sp. MALMAid0571]|uniref:beta-N-acetylhexosaminidase n=1 Tax=Reichenbachiella sp. MALMAid0571 TaxID=3143939 RepID=UPI0032DF524D
MNLLLKSNIYGFLFLFLLNATAFGQGIITDLRSKGYTIFPTPQKVNLSNKSIIIDASWRVLSKDPSSQKALNSLSTRAGELHNLSFSGKGTGLLELKVVKNAIAGLPGEECSKQAYRITIKSDHVLIEGNEEVGLFYGVQSFLQLLKPTAGGRFQLPEGTITDWPDLELRFIHWDTKHHRDKMETLKRYIDWSAYFKVNAIAFEIEDKYEYPRHPIIGAPNAFTKAEMQELTKYALDRFIQLVPNVQAPAHMAFVLKHKEFEHLKADDESNYQACMCDEEAMELIFDMYQDMIDATPGVDYFFASTDEVYYAGTCDKCKPEYNEVNRSQAWVDFLVRVNKWMAKRGRRVLAWVEYPLLPKDISKVPNGVIDAIMGSSKSREWTVNETKTGLDQLSYSSIQGAEFLFPNYFPVTYRGKYTEGRLSTAYHDISDREANGANLIGTFAAAWDDAGLHNETFWLGWASVTQYGWTKKTPSLQQNIADFMDVFYGADSPEMVEVYELLEEGARFYENIWDKVPTKERKKGYGSSFGKGIGGDYMDLMLNPPSLPAVNDLSIEPSFREKYSQNIETASVLLKKNDLLISRLMRSISRVRHNSYNLEVFLSIAYLERYAMNTMINLAAVEDNLVKASKAGDDHAKAIDLLIETRKLSGKILKEQDDMWSGLMIIWEKSRLPKNESVGGKEFYHVYDDLKDHFADRRKGLDFMLAPFSRIGLSEWRDKLNEIIQDYASLHNVSIRGIEAERLED